ncbi:MAG: hypothetical protein WCA81_12170 [Rhizomicrobium sp.]
MRIRHLRYFRLAGGLALFIAFCCSADPAQSAEKPGLYVLLQVDIDQVCKDQAEATVGNIRRALREAQIGYTGLSASGTGVSLRILDSSRFAQAVEWITALNPEMGHSLQPPRQYDIAEPGDGRIVLTMTDTYKDRVRKDFVNRSEDVIRRRLDKFDVANYSVEQQGEDRIAIRVYGSHDRSVLLEIIEPSSKLTFRLVDEMSDVGAAQRGNIPADDELLEQKSRKGETKPPLLVEKRVLVDGCRLKTASWAADPQNDRGIVALTFDEGGAHQLAVATKENLFRQFAIVFDKIVISAPKIEEPIIGGQVEIDGFTVRSAIDFVVLLCPGVLPAPFHVLEKREIP